MFVKLEGKRCLVVGAGRIAEGKIQGLRDTDAEIHVVALQASPAVEEWARAGLLKLELRPFSASDFDGAVMAIVATSSRECNREAYAEAKRRGVLCNVVDVPELCDFYYPAVVQRGDLQIAVSTNGQSPTLAQRLREQLEQQFPAAYAEWVAELGETRRQILASDLNAKEKRDLIQSLAGPEALQALLAKAPENRRKGEVA